MKRLYVTICILVAIAAFQAGFILANWEKWDIHGKLLNHETRIMMLEGNENTQMLLKWENKEKQPGKEVKPKSKEAPKK